MKYTTFSPFTILTIAINIGACRTSTECHDCTNNLSTSSTEHDTDIYTSTYSDISTSSSSSTFSSTSIFESTSSGSQGNSESETGEISTGIKHYCGDAIIDPGETCDNGTQNKALDEALKNDCTIECEKARCGDFRLNKDEECDDDENCNNCVLCGNGIKNETEECDDGNTNLVDGCGENCKIEHVAFVTSETYTGNLGGFSGADTKCQTLANKASMETMNFGKLKFKAWIADNNKSPIDNFSDELKNFNGIIRKANGEIFVVDGWKGLLKNMLYNALDCDEYGNHIDSFDEKNIPYVWSNVGAPVDQQNYCKGGNNFSWSANFGVGNIGLLGTILKDWTFYVPPLENINEIKCSNQHRLYCISQ